jgi:hypothetical protein
VREIFVHVYMYAQAYLMFTYMHVLEDDEQDEIAVLVRSHGLRPSYAM